MTNSEVDYMFKTVALGLANVGKTCLIKRFCDGEFLENGYNTIGVDLKMKTIKVAGKTIKLQIWDTAGSERFAAMTNNYYKGSHGVMAVYDITNVESFNYISNLLAEIKQAIREDAIVYLVGNKSDLEKNRAVSTEQGEKLARDFEIRFFETSAKNADNVNKAFEKLALEMRNKVNPLDGLEGSISLKKDAPQTNLAPKSCCGYI